MSVSGINSYNTALYKWQAQKLKDGGSSSGSSSSSSAASSLFSGQSMTSQLSSMIELTKYAMDAMGVTGNAKVTFSQISKYREQLQSEFTQGVKDGFAATGIKDINALSFSIDKNGVATASGANADDRKKAQAWLDSNPSFGADLAKKIAGAGIENEGFSFKLSSTGRMTVIDEASQRLQAALNEDSEAIAALREGLEAAGFAANQEFKFDADLNLVASGPDAEKLDAWLKDNPQFADGVKETLSKNNLSPASVTLSLSGDSLRASVASADNADIQAVLDKETESGKKAYAALDDLGIDKNVEFSIRLTEDGGYEIISDHPDKDKVISFFEEHPELIKKFMQIETLAGIDDARKAMQISPTEMRKRIQIESMAAWWATSDDSSSYFGQYSSGNMSLLAGLNLNI